MVVLKKLRVEDTLAVLQQAIRRLEEEGDTIPAYMDASLLEWIAKMADGDAR